MTNKLMELSCMPPAPEIQTASPTPSSLSLDEGADYPVEGELILIIAHSLPCWRRLFAAFATNSSCEGHASSTTITHRRRKDGSLGRRAAPLSFTPIASRSLMKNAFFALTTILMLSSGDFIARALDAPLVSAQSDTTMTAGASAQPQASHGDVASSASCRQVDVAIDEGYGVSSHETRWECGPPP